MVPMTPEPVRGRSIERVDVAAALNARDEKLQLDPEDFEALVRQVVLSAEARVAGVEQVHGPSRVEALRL